MAYKPILFNTEMVKAIMEGRKTQTRRVLKLKYKDNEAGFQILTNTHDGSFAYAEYYDEDEEPTRMITPPCMPGSILWVRETWCDPEPDNYMVPVFYKADMPLHWDAEDTAHGEAVDITEDDFKWHPSIHMPKEAARIFLRVKDVRVERLRDISCHDAAAEGVDDVEPCDDDELLCNYCPLEDNEKGVHNYGSGPVMCEGVRCREAFDAWTEEFVAEFSTIWNSTIKPADLGKYGWDANPWVWVITFELCDRPEGWPNV